jgi:hypothetical protein
MATTSKSKERRTYHCIKPRYTPGIPATVDYEFAKQFTIEERNEYRKCLRSEYGQEMKDRADRLGLEGIANTRIKHTDKKDRISWSITDLITSKEIEHSLDAPPENEFKPIYILAIEIQYDWDSPNLASAQLVKLMRRVSNIGDTTVSDKNTKSTAPVTAVAEEIIIRFLASSSDWRTIKSQSIKKELRDILCGQISKIQDEDLKAMAKTICKRFE